MRNAAFWIAAVAAFFLFPEALDLSGTVGWVLALLGITAVVTPLAVHAAILRNLPEEPFLREVAEREVPPEVRRLVDAFAADGFERAAPPMRVDLQNSAIVVPLHHPQEGFLATVYAIEAQTTKVAYDVVSILDATDCALTTAMDAGAGVLPAPPGALRQIFPGATVDELLSRHREGVRWLASQRIPTIAVSPTALLPLLRRSFATQRQAFLAARVSNTFVAIARTITKRNPSLGPLGSQRGVEARIGVIRLRRGPAARAAAPRA